MSRRLLKLLSAAALAAMLLAPSISDALALSEGETREVQEVTLERHPIREQHVQRHIVDGPTLSQVRRPHQSVAYTAPIFARSTTRLHLLSNISPRAPPVS